MTITTLASGSSGNCILVSHGATHLLVDAGISCRRIKNALADLGLTPGELTAVLITHEHSDHISGLATLFKQYHLPVWCSAGTGRQLAYRIAFLEEVLHTFAPGDTFPLGNLTVTSFATSHDAADSVGYTFTDGVRKAAIVTDLGVVTPVVEDCVRGSDLLVAEANHDPGMLMDGPYPPYLKQRILGARGHLSNAACAELARHSGARTVVLAHLSAENNRPSLALETVRAGLGGDVTVEVAPRSETGRRYVVN
ncbi:MAG: MBL fold metallo-hydrolase [Oscillospiraceae bacterium]